MSDAYAHIVHGDDAGKSARLVYIARPQPVNTQKQSLSKFNLGMTFIEVNGRAYVRTISDTSQAALVGVQPRDAVQFAIVLGGPNLDEMGQDSNWSKERAVAFVLECEQRGMRITYDELRDMFSDCCIDGERTEGGVVPTFESPSTAHPNSAKRAVHRTLRKAAACTTASASSSSVPLSADVDDAPSTPSNADGAALYPVALVFRRTRKRRVALSGLSHVPGFPSYRLDEECDRAASLIRRLAPTADTAPQPDAWDEIVHDGTEWLMGINDGTRRQLHNHACFKIPMRLLLLLLPPDHHLMRHLLLWKMM